MDYEFTVKGTLVDEDEEEVVLTEACEMVAELEGVTSATFSSPNFTGVNMLEDQEPQEPGTPPAEESEPSEAPAEAETAEEQAEKEAEEDGEE